MSQLQEERVHWQLPGRHLQVAEPQVSHPLEAAVLTVEICAGLVTFWVVFEQQDIVRETVDICACVSENASNSCAHLVGSSSVFISSFLVSGHADKRFRP